MALDKLSVKGCEDPFGRRWPVLPVRHGLSRNVARAEREGRHSMGYTLRANHPASRVVLFTYKFAALFRCVSRKRVSWPALTAGGCSRFEPSTHL